MKIVKNLRKLKSEGLFIVLFISVLSGISCANEAPPEAGRGEVTDKQQLAESVAQAEDLYRQREDLSKLRQGITLLRQARVVDYGNYEIAWKLAKFDYYLGSHTDDERERDDAFREGIAAGKTAVQIAGDKPEGHFWLGANYGGTAEHSIVAGLANVEDIRREMEAVIKIDEEYQSGSAYLGLGQLYLQAPKILGGDTQKAIGYLEKGLKFGPNNALLRARLAEAYEAANRDADARREIGFLLKMTPHPDYVPEHKEAVEKGKKLLEKMDREN
jgi:tetratricopeptide (TPR) repeat protein